MPRKRTTTTAPVDDDEVELQSMGEVEDDDGGNWTTFIDSLPIQDSILTFERRADTGEWLYCCAGPQEGASLDDLRDAFGPGQYRCIARHPTKKHVVRRRIFRIAGMSSPATPPAAIDTGASWISRHRPRPSDPSPAPSSASGPSITDQSRVMDQLMQALIARAIEPPPSMLDQLAKVAAAMTAATPLLARFIPERKDPIELAAKLADVKAQNQGTGAIDIFLKGMEMSRQFRGGGARPEPDRNSLGAVVRDFLPSLLDVMRQAAAASPSFHHPPDIAPAPTALPTTSEPVPTNVYDAMRAQVPQLMKWAQEGRDPQDVAGAIRLQIPPYAMGIVEQETRLPAWHTRWFQQYPELEPYRAWVTDVLTEVANIFHPDDGDEEASDEP